MKDLTVYAVKADIVSKSMKGIFISPSEDSIIYRKYKGRPVTIGRPSEEELYLLAYGAMIMEGYTLVASPDGQAYLCGGGETVYHVTDSGCTCPSSTYSTDTPCKHTVMLRGYKEYANRAITLRAGALT
jgi:hypothetical protein